MAIIDCKECGKPISSEAASCPNCGHPTKKEKKGLFLSSLNVSCGLLIAVVLIVFLFAGIFGYMTCSQ